MSRVVETVDRVEEEIGVQFVRFTITERRIVSRVPRDGDRVVTEKDDWFFREIPNY